VNLETLKVKAKEIGGSKLLKDLQVMIFLVIVVGLFYLVASSKRGLTPGEVIAPLEHESVMDRK